MVIKGTLQCHPFIMLWLLSIGTDPVISDSCYKGAIFKGIIGKCPFHGPFPMISL